MVTHNGKDIEKYTITLGILDIFKSSTHLIMDTESHYVSKNINVIPTWN